MASSVRLIDTLSRWRSQALHNIVAGTQKYCTDHVKGVARSRQVCIYVVEALLIAIYLGNGLILVDIRKPSAERLSRPI